MKKIGAWILNHAVLVLAILTFGITFIVIGCVILSSRLSYNAYEQRYNEIDLEVRSQSPAQPKYIEIDNSFKSSRKKKLQFGADELTVTTTQDNYLIDNYIDLTEKGGSISIKLDLEEKSFVDIDFEIATEYYKAASNEDEEDENSIKDLLSNVQFIVNGETMEEVVDLPNDGWQHLVMMGFALPQGEVSVEIKSLSNKQALMPQLKQMTFFSNQALSVVEEAAA